MKILVGVKRVIDYKAAIRVRADGLGIETTNMKMSINPFDEIALEEAVRIKQKGNAQEIIAVSIGGDATQETLRIALAMGADRAVLISTTVELQSFTVAKILEKIVRKEEPRLVLLGKQAIDCDDNQVGQMLAGFLNWPQATFASKVEFINDNIQVTREIDEGNEILRLNLPAVITADLRLNEPRYLSLPAIVQAKRKSLEIIAADSLNLDLNPRIKTIKVSQPAKRRSGVKVENVADLVYRLKHEAQVL